MSTPEDIERRLRMIKREVTPPSNSSKCFWGPPCFAFQRSRIDRTSYFHPYVLLLGYLHATLSLMLGGRRKGRSLKIRRTPLGEQGVMKWSDESAESSELDGPPLRRRSPPQKHQKIEEKTRLQKNMLFLKNDPKVSLKVDPKIVQNCIPASFLRYRKNTKFRKRFFSRFYCFRDARDVENPQFSLQIQ